MKCEICGKTPMVPPNGDGVTLHRVNALGEIGVWRCDNDLTDDQRKALDPDTQGLVGIIEDASRGRVPFAATAKYNFTDHAQTLEQMRAKAEALWQLLDDISTAFDMAKPELEWFEKYVWGKCEQRGKHFKSDGYKLYATDHAPQTDSPASGQPVGPRPRNAAE